MGLLRLRTFLVLLVSTFLLAFFGYSQSQLQVGYVVVSPGPGSAAPIGTALFSFTNSQGVLLWEAGVGAAVPIRSGRIFVDQSAGTRTAIALANPSDQPVSATLVLRDSIGSEVARLLQSFVGRQHRARFIDELFSPLPAGFATGSLSFETASGDQKLAAITLRENKNTSMSGSGS